MGIQQGTTIMTLLLAAIIVIAFAMVHALVLTMLGSRLPQLMAALTGAQHSTRQGMGSAVPLRA